MSRENVELLDRAYDAFNRRDLDAFLEVMDSDVELIPFERMIEGGGAYRGHSGLEVGQIWAKGAGIFHIRGGKVTRLVQYLDRENAIERVGLSE